MKGLDELVDGIKSGYAYFYCESQEVNKTVADIQIGLEEYYKTNKNGSNHTITVWDFEATTTMGESIYQNPDEMFLALENFSGGVDTIPVGTIVIAKNYNWFLVDEYGNCDKGKVSWLLNRSEKFSSPEYRKILIIVGNQEFQKAVPEILKREFAHVEFSLPDEKEIEFIYNFIVNSAKDNPKFKLPDEKTKQRIIAGARGLSKSEIIKVFSYSIVRNKGIFDPLTVEQLRSDEINSTAGLSIRKYDSKLEDLKGFEVAKEIVQEWIDDKDAKGLILLGVAGTGKTHFAQSLASAFNRLIIEFEMAGVMGDGLVGQAEKAMKKALDVISANANPIAPIILFIDEIEKGLAGTSSAGGQGGARDGGTTDRSNAQFLKFLSDARPKGIYIIATCNDIEKLPSAYVRAERWDTAPVFVDLPTAEERMEILKHYQKMYGVNVQPKDMVDWTGAEIKAWAKLAQKKISLGKDPHDADKLIVPVAKTMNKEIEYLRKWKEGRTIPASRRAVVNQKATARKLEI